MHKVRIERGGKVSKKKITKKAQREILKDIRRQLVWIEQAIKDGDQGWIDQYSNQLAATAGSLHSEDF
jgi:hypothetical protein